MRELYVISYTLSTQKYYLKKVKRNLLYNSIINMTHKKLRAHWNLSASYSGQKLVTKQFHNTDFINQN